MQRGQRRRGLGEKGKYMKKNWEVAKGRFGKGEG